MNGSLFSTYDFLEHLEPFSISEPGIHICNINPGYLAGTVGSVLLAKSCIPLHFVA
jgi:hypothetical protein